MASPNPNRLSAQLSPFDSASGRQSPFRRQNSQSPATAAAGRGSTPTSSPPKGPSSSSPIKTGGLSPEKANPFTRRPSQLHNDRPTSPFARPASSLSFSSPTRQTSNVSLNSNLSEPQKSPFRRPSATPEPEQPPSRQPSVTPAPEELLSETTAKTRSPLSLYDGTRHSAAGDKENVPEDSPFYIPSMATPTDLRSNVRPHAQRNMSSSTTTTIKPPVFTTQHKVAAPKLNGLGGGAYNHIPQPLLHSMRESFEVLDSNNTGSVNSAAVADMLSQLGMETTPAALKDFFPPNGPSQLNLARYLDILAGPLSDLSEPDELRAGFEAFDVDDSGQIDVHTLRDALLNTAPEPGEQMIRLSEREVDNVLGEFTGRRAFGAKGLNAGKAKGEVFRYRDFMANVSGGGAGSTNELETAIMA